MKTYNDYANLVWNYLRNYTQLKITLLNLQDEARIKKSQAEAFSTAISRYGDDPTGGYCELNQTERGAARRMEMAEGIARIERDIEEIRLLLNKLDRAIGGLDATSRSVVEEYFMERKTWEAIGAAHYYTGKWARERAKKAAAEIAFMMFGTAAHAKRASFCFAGYGD